jgi:hypothetical protein
MDNSTNKFRQNVDALTLHQKAYERRLHKLAQREDAIGDNRGDRTPEGRHDGKAAESSPESSPVP